MYFYVCNCMYIVKASKIDYFERKSLCHIFLPLLGFANLISMWEMYEIHPSLPMKVKYIGYWNMKMGIQVKENKKWIRRHDLEVSTL